MGIGRWPASADAREHVVDVVVSELLDEGAVVVAGAVESGKDTREPRFR